MFTAGALVLVMSILRVTVVRLRETPKYLLGAGEETRLVLDLQTLAQKYDRPCSLTVEKLAACGRTRALGDGGGRKRSFFSETWVHLTGLFATRKMAISTAMIWFSWTLVGLAYPLFYAFLRYVITLRHIQSTGFTFLHAPYPYFLWTKSFTHTLLRAYIHTYAIICLNSLLTWGKQCLPPEPGRLHRCGTVRDMAKLHTHDDIGHLRAGAGGVAVQHGAPGPAVHDGGGGAPHPGLLLRVHDGLDAGAERRLQLRHRLLRQHLLRHPVRLHARGAAERPPRHRQRRRRRLQPLHGHHVERRFHHGRYGHQRPDLRLRRALRRHGPRFGPVSVRTLRTA